MAALRDITAIGEAAKASTTMARSPRTTTSSKPKGAGFLDLPIEIRLMIYDLHFGETTFEFLGTRTGKRPRNHALPNRNRVAILRSCKAVPEDVGGSWIPQVTFCFATVRQFLDVLNDAPVEIRRNVRSVIIDSPVAQTSFSLAHLHLADAIKLIPGIHIDTLTIDLVNSEAAATPSRRGPPFVSEERVTVDKLTQLDSPPFEHLQVRCRQSIMAGWSPLSNRLLTGRDYKDYDIINVWKEALRLARFRFRHEIPTGDEHLQAQHHERAGYTMNPHHSLHFYVSESTEPTEDDVWYPETRTEVDDAWLARASKATPSRQLGVYQWKQWNDTICLLTIDYKYSRPSRVMKFSGEFHDKLCAQYNAFTTAKTRRTEPFTWSGVHEVEELWYNVVGPGSRTK
ncbi:MAG: hypothetical protein Q9162_005245 [Coniocarpon cinnabarinum]